jgi:hypothetical protein
MGTTGMPKGIPVFLFLPMPAQPQIPASFIFFK